MGNLGAAWARLSGREKAMVGFLGGTVLGTAIFFFWLFVGSSVGDLEDKLEADRGTLEKIYKAAGPYLSAVKATEAQKKAAKKNSDLNLKLAVNDLAKGIQFQSIGRDGNPAGMKKLSDVMAFDQTQESFLSRRKKKRRKKKDGDVDTGYWRRDQPVTLSENVPFSAIYELMESIEEDRRLMFVTDVEMTREFQDGRIARKNATLVVSTYYWKGADG